MAVRHLGTATFNDSPEPRRLTCPHCAWYGYGPVFLRAHINAVHKDMPASRVPRGSDYAVMSPATRRFLRAADDGEGLHAGRKWRESCP